MAEKKKRVTIPKTKVAPKAEVKAEVEAEVKPEGKPIVEPIVEILKCKSCGSDLKKILFDSRADKPLYLWVCDNRNCVLYRQPQGYDGELPLGMKVPMV